MVRNCYSSLFVILFISFNGLNTTAQQVGSIRGMVYDQDFDVPLGDAQILISETNQQVTSGEEGNYVINQVAPGTYTLVFSKQGYTRQVKSNERNFKKFIAKYFSMCNLCIAKLPQKWHNT